MANPAFRHNDINTLEMPWACMQNAVIVTVSSLYLHPQDNGDMTTLNGKAHQHAHSCYMTSVMGTVAIRMTKILLIVFTGVSFTLHVILRHLGIIGYSIILQDF